MPFTVSMRNLIVTFAFACAALAFVCMCIGAKSIPPSEVARSLFSKDGSNDHLVIVFLRLPRVLLGLLIGASLGTAGAVLQGLTRNSLADPAVLGINGGASLAVVLAGLVSNRMGFGWSYSLAFCGGLGMLLLVYSAASLIRGSGPSSLLIVGAVLGGLASSITTTLLLCSGHDVSSILYWLLGSLNGSDMHTVRLVTPVLVVGFALSMTLGSRLNALRLGEDVAAGLGVGLMQTRALACLAVALLVSACVASVGPIGFVGLLIAHLIRSFVGPDYRKIIPLSALAGSSFLIASDLVARVGLWKSYEEIPVGLVTACLGAPMLLLVLRSKRVSEA